MQPLYEVFHPGPPLDKYVDHFWLIENYPASPIEKLLPDGGLELILNLGEPRYLHDLVDPRRYRVFRDSWISGQRSEAILIGSPTPSDLIGVRFRIFGAYPFLHIPLHEITDRVTDAAAICGHGIDSLRDRIASANTPHAKFAMLERFLCGRLQGNPRHERLMMQTVQSVSAAISDDRIERLAQQTGFSGKHLGRLFQTMVGLSPKALFRVCRLQRVIKHIEHATRVNWSLVAHECGYFDQSHFIKEFKAFTQLTPTEYLAARGPFLNYLPLAGIDEQAVA